MYTALARNRRYSALLFALFGLVATGLAVWLSVLAHSVWPAITILLVATFYTITQVREATRLAAHITGCVDVTPEQQPALHRIVSTLAVRNAIPRPRVCVINDPTPNALALGMTHDDAIIAITRGALEVLSPAELEGVLAHEMAHIVNLDSRVKLTIFSLVGAFGVMAAGCFAIAAFFSEGQTIRRNPAAVVGGAVFVLGVLLSVISVIVGPLIAAALSREREYLADASAFEMIRYADGLASALATIERFGGTMRHHNPITSSFYFAKPVRQGLFAWLYATHPPTHKRLGRLDEISRGF